MDVFVRCITFLRTVWRHWTIYEQLETHWCRRAANQKRLVSMLRSLQSNVALAEFYSFPRAVVLHCQVTSSILRTPYVSLTHVSYSGLFLKSCMSMPGYVIRSSRVAHACKGRRIATRSYHVRPWTLLRDMRYKEGCEDIPQYCELLLIF